MLIAHTEGLEQFHWFVRAHLEDKGGNLATTGATTEVEAADAAGGSSDADAHGEAHPSA